MIKLKKNKQLFVVFLVLLQILSVLVSRDLVLNNNIDQQNRELPFLGDENRSVLSKSFQDAHSKIAQNDGLVLDSEREQDSENSNSRAINLRAQDPEVLDSGSDNFEVTEQYTGTGSYFGSNRLNTSNVIQNSTRSTGFSAPTALDYERDAGSFTISNIKADSDWQTIENDSGPIDEKMSNQWYEIAMAFEIPVDYANLTEIKVQLQKGGGGSLAAVDAYILNSTWSGDEWKPSTSTSDILSDKVPKNSTDSTWYNFSFETPATLRKGITYFVVLNDTHHPTGGAYWQWQLKDDSSPSEDQGAFYHRNDTHSGEWTNDSYDLILSVRILPVENDGQTVITYDSEQHSPELALLKYGSTWLNDTTDLVSISMDETDTHLFTSNISITFDLVWSRNFTIHSFSASSHFYVANGTSVTWNLTFSAHEISEISYPVRNHLLNLSHSDRLPSDWNLMMTYNETIKYENSNPEVLYQKGDPYLIVNASNGLNNDTWGVEFSSPNYLVTETLETEKVIGGTPTDYRGQTINVISQFMEDTTDGLYNISATFPNGTHAVIPGAAQLPVSAGTEIKKIDLVANWFLPNGSYNITVVFWNGTEAGLLVKPLVVLTPTELVNIIATTALFVGEYYNLTVHFNDTSAGEDEGITYANVVLNASWWGPLSMNATGKTGEYNASIPTYTASVGSASVNITANKQYYQNDSKVWDVEFRQHTVMEKLAFSINVDNDLYYTDAFNITVNLHNDTDPGDVVPGAEVIARSNYAPADNQQFTPFANGTSFWLEVDTTGNTTMGTFSLNVTFEQLYFESQLSDTKKFTIKANLTNLSAWTHANGTIVTTVYYDSIQKHTFFIQWHDCTHDLLIDATNVQINSSKVIQVVNDSNGSHTFEFTPNITGIDFLNSIEILLTRDGYESLVYVITFDVQKLLVELMLTVPKTLVRGEDFWLEARLLQTLGVILLGLGDDPVQNELISFSVTILFENNTELTFIENSRTNDEGLARFFLSREVTRNLRTFIGISVTYGGSEVYQGTTITVAAENLPSIHSQTAEKDLLINQLFGFFVDYILLIFLVLLGVFILSFFSMNKLRSHQMAWKEDRAYVKYLEELRTVRMIVIRQLDGVPLFSQSMFGSDKSLDHAVAGLSTALSAFLQDIATRSIGEGSSIGEDRPEFVRMEQRGLHLLQRNGAYTAAIVISDAALGKFIEDNLRSYQMAIEKRFHTEFEQFFSSGQIPTDVLAALASKHLYIGLVGAFQLNETKLESAEKLLTGKASRIVAELWNYKKEIPDHRMFLDSYISYLENQGIPVAESFRFLLKGYQDGLFEPLSYAELLQEEEQM